MQKGAPWALKGPECSPFMGVFYLHERHIRNYIWKWF